ncbi:MAG: hypothetical protein ACJ77A_02740 [Actinomycetota bacterium]
MRLSRPVRAVLSGVCWTLGVGLGLITAAAFAGGGVMCQTGTRAACRPQTWLLVVGIVLAVALGFAGAVLYKPRTKRQPRFPWEYPK